MKILKFYMNCGVPQTVTIEEILGHPYDNNNLPHVAGISIQRMAGCDAGDVKIPWSFSNFLASKGKPADYWYNMNCHTNPYNLYWEKYVEYCKSSYVNPVDDLLEVMLEAPTFSQDNFLKIIINGGNEGDYDIDDYVNMKMWKK